MDFHIKNILSLFQCENIFFYNMILSVYTLFSILRAYHNMFNQYFFASYLDDMQFLIL